MLEDEFEQTSVNMSTYLVAFIVANFTSITRNVSSTLVRTESLPQSIHTSYMACNTLECDSVYSVPIPPQLWYYCIYSICTVCVAGVSVLCAREEGTHTLCSGHSLQAAALLQHLL